MKIPEKLPQFKDMTSLIIATGKQDAIFYIAHNGEIQQVDSFKVEKPQYSDIEGHFETRNDGKTYRAGSPYEPTDKENKTKTEFLKELSEEIESVSRHHTIHTLYIFTPSYLKNEVSKTIPHSLHQIKYYLLKGNFFHQHPRELLTRIQKLHQRNPIQPITEAAYKILHTFKR